MRFKPVIPQVNISFSFLHSYLGPSVEADAREKSELMFYFQINLGKETVLGFILGSEWRSWNFWVLRYPLSKFSNTLSPLTGGL